MRRNAIVAAMAAVSMGLVAARDSAAEPAQEPEDEGSREYRCNVATAATVQAEARRVRREWRSNHEPNNGTTYYFPPEKVSKRRARRLRGKAKAAA